MVAALLEEQLGTTVYARRYAPGGYTWEQHLADAADPSRLLHSLLGPGGEKPWDCVVFQVRPLHYPCTVPVANATSLGCCPYNTVMTVSDQYADLHCLENLCRSRARRLRWGARRAWTA